MSDTEATAELLVDQVTVRPVRMLLPASRVTALSWVVWPAWSAFDAAVIDTVATGGGMTFTIRVAVFPSDVAVIVTWPAATPVTRPAVLTVAMLVFDVDHVIVRFESALPFASRAVAKSCVVCPMDRSLAEAAMSTDATAGGPEESPPQATTNASVHGRRSASRVRVIILVSCESGRLRPPEGRRSKLGRHAQMAKGARANGRARTACGTIESVECARARADA